MALDNNMIFLALAAGFVSLIVLAMVIVFFRKRALSARNERLREQRLKAGIDYA